MVNEISQVVHLRLGSQSHVSSNVEIPDHPEPNSRPQQTSSLPTKTRQRRSYQASGTTRPFKSAKYTLHASETCREVQNCFRMRLFDLSPPSLNPLIPLLSFRARIINVHSLRTIMLLRECRPKGTVYEAPELPNSSLPKVPSL